MLVKNGMQHWILLKHTQINEFIAEKK